MHSIILSLLVCLSAVAAADRGGGTAGGPRTVLVELFTSEGCSSCPAADEYVAQLVRAQPIKNVRIVALSEHVDYWNSLGWRDPFSSPEFTRRQRRYAERLNTEVYTPQLVIDGIDQVIGSQRSRVYEAIHRAGKRDKAELEMTAERTGNGSIDVRVSVGDVPRGPREIVLWAALVEDGLAVDVENGENRGRELRHDGVARLLIDTGNIAANRSRGVSLEIEPGWNASKLRVVAFLEDGASGRVIGAASAIPSSPAEEP